MTADQARGLVSDDHPYCLGFFDTALNWAAKLVGRADAVMLLGKKMDNTIRYGGIFDDAARIVQVDPSPTEIGRNRAVDVGMAGGVSAIVEQMTLTAQGISLGGDDNRGLRRCGNSRGRKSEWFDGIAKARIAHARLLRAQGIVGVPEARGHSGVGRRRLRPLW